MASRTQRGAHRHDRGPPTEAIEILTRAQREADKYVAEARDYAQHLVDDAQAKAQTILDEARSHTPAPAPAVPPSVPVVAVTDAAAQLAHLPTDVEPTPVPSNRSNLLWTRTFLASLHNVETQLRTAREALSSEFDRLGRPAAEDAHAP